MAATVGLLGGSFNPVHAGHMMLAGYLRQHSRLDALWLVLSPQNPLKQSLELVEDSHRLAMLEIAARSVPGIRVSDVELTMPRPSYTIDTLEKLSADYPDTRFKLVIGSDNWRIFDQWKSSRRIIEQYGLMVYPRPGYPLPSSPVEGVEAVRAPMVDISSTFIREGLAQGKNMDRFLPAGVGEYIRENRLYGCGGQA